MNEDIVLKFVIESISDSSGLDQNEIQENKTLFKELDLTSIDIVEIFYLLEMEYDIALKVSDFDKDIRENMNGEAFEIDDVITPQGLKAIKQNFPEIKAEYLTPGLTVNQLLELITVRTLARLVYKKHIINQS